MIKLNRFDWNPTKISKNFIRSMKTGVFDKRRQRSLVWKLNKE